MLLKEGIQVSQFDDGRWVLNTGEGRNILINQPTSELISILQEHNTAEAALAAFNSQFGSNLDAEAFTSLLNKKFAGYNILNNDQSSSQFKKGKYLNLKIPFFSPKVAGWLATPFQWLFGNVIFWTLAALMSSFAVYTFATTGGFNAFEVNKIDFLLFACLVYPSVLYHEIGHIASCRASKVKHGGIGFAFYFIIPVLYSDVTNIWQTRKHRRVITNLAGIFMEFLYASIIAVIYYRTKEPTLLAAYCTIIIKTLFELNPFIRSDGYWILSDITNTPNLLAKANSSMQKIRKQLFASQSRNRKISWSAIWLSVYGIANTSILLGYAGYMIINHRTTIIHFPSILWDIGKKASQLELTQDMLKGEYLLVLAFYWILVRMIYKLIKKKLASDTAIRLFRMAGSAE